MIRVWRKTAGNTSCNLIQRRSQTEKPNGNESHSNAPVKSEINNCRECGMIWVCI